MVVSVNMSVTAPSSIHLLDLTRAYSRISWRIPLNVPAGYDAIVEIVICEDRPHFGIPRPTKRTFVLDVKRIIRFGNVAIMDIHSILVGKSCVCALPSSDATTTASQLDL